MDTQKLKCEETQEASLLAIRPAKPANWLNFLIVSFFLHLLVGTLWSKEILLSFFFTSVLPSLALSFGASLWTHGFFPPMTCVSVSMIIFILFHAKCAPNIASDIPFQFLCLLNMTPLSLWSVSCFLAQGIPGSVCTFSVLELESAVFPGSPSVFPLVSSRVGHRKYTNFF